ncbi:MAG: Ferrous iron transport protein B [uncultured Campylobacterales bacterium]|uniref:Ferrous iron transport protein B n=1 Tax=uncultured Campylobacterales bacterium TaxID=352960 RepID=A0A6S6T7Y5_9BACT|nr:MAG: Ferrous iron transport protein B [uncultured Campylobacterales bacterium]
MNNIKIALVGQPNVGKSMLINSISNSKLKVGNFSGVTVEKKEVKLSFESYNLTIVDLPGTYSLNNFTPDEEVTKDFLEVEDNYDLILNVVDSTNLSRNLLLTTQLLELGKPVVLALNMMDEADKENIQIDSKQMGAILGIEAIKVSAAKKQGLENLLKAIVKTVENSKENKLIYSEPIEEEIANISQYLESKQKDYPNKRILCIKLLQEDEKTYKRIHESPIYIGLAKILRNAQSHISTHYNSNNMKKIFKQERLAFVKGVMTETVQTKVREKKTLTQKIDSILINKFIGLPIFLGFMWILFWFTFTLGSIPMDYIDGFFGFLSKIADTYIKSPGLSSLISDGIIPGVGAVILFLPNIIILFIGISLLETTGYMNRIAFLLDGFFHKFGLHGKSFIPLVTGFGCSVPAYMSARTLKNKTQRLLTMFIIGFMSCGARLPVYILFIGAFFADSNPGNILFIIYISGALLGIFMAKILKMFVFKDKNEPFVMDMPKYRLPTLKLIWHTVYTKALMYLKKAGTFILAASIIIWFASSYPKNLDIQNEYQTKIENSDNKDELQNELQQKLLENSYLGKIGKFTQPLFAPLGFDWKMTVALESGLAAKEVVVSTLGVLYSLGDTNDETSSSLITQLKENIALPSAVAFIIFIMIYLPCLAASLVFAKEAGGFSYLAYLFIFTTLTAWVFSFIGFHVTRFLI